MTALLSVWNFCKSNKIFLICLFAIHAVYFFCAIHYEGICTQDSDEYLQTAENLKYHFTCYNWIWTDIKNPVFYSMRPPAYGVFILICKSFYNSDYTVLIAQNLISIGIWLLTIHLSKLFYPNYKIELPIIVSLLLIPTQMIMVNSIAPEILLEFLLIICLGCISYYIKEKNTWYLIIYNIALSLAVLSKPVMMYFWVPNLILFGYIFYKKRN